jgi:hypothetical protein
MSQRLATHCLLHQRDRVNCSPRRRPGPTTEQKAFVTIPIRPKRHVRESLVGARGLIFGLIRLRSSTFICIQINATVQVSDVNGIW